MRRAKTAAVARGISLKQPFAEALEEKLKAAATPVSSPVWMDLAGAFGMTPSDRAETRRIQQRIDAEFEVLEHEDAQ